VRCRSLWVRCCFLCGALFPFKFQILVVFLVVPRLSFKLL
jgi:hypothetical protein